MHPATAAGERQQYVLRMKKARQFQFFGLEPKWHPGTGDIAGFVHDEVVRQWHDTEVEEDGGKRVRFMAGGWSYAQRMAHGGRKPDLEDIMRLGHYVEPELNSGVGFRTVHVSIAGYPGADPGLVLPMINILALRAQDVLPQQGGKGPHADEYRKTWLYSDYKDVLPRFQELTKQIVTADDWYLAYEAVHPFADGNGRTGKILHNWLLGTLDDPVLVKDYFGGGNP